MLAWLLASLGHLWGDGKGKFRTQGRYAAATIRGTRWLTDDRCNGTLKKSLVPKKPKSYLAPAVKQKRG